MLLAKIRDVLLNRRNKVEVDDVEVKGEIPASIKSLIQSIAGELDGTSFKLGGYYILKEETNKLDWVEELPEDFSGTTFNFEQGQINFFNYFEGQQISSSYITSYELEFYDEQTEEEVIYGTTGAPKLNFEALTHSFNELDPTLKQIVEDAIDDGDQDGVACSEAQWSVIKSLLEKSLYLNYGNWSMIKGTTDGFTTYTFGIKSIAYGAQLSINYNVADKLLFALFEEL